MSKVTHIIACSLALLIAVVADAQQCPVFHPQQWVKLPAPSDNLSVVDGTLRCYSGGLLLRAPLAQGGLVALEGDTTFRSIDNKMDYVVRHPSSKLLYFTRPNSHRKHKLFCAYMQNGSMKTERIRLTGIYSIDHPTFSPDGQVMIFSSANGEYGGSDLYYSRLQANGEWSDPHNLGPLVNGTGDEVAPVVSGDFLYYATRDDIESASWRLRATRLYPLQHNDSLTLRPVLGQNSAFDLPAPFNSKGDNLDLAFDNENGYIYLLSSRSGEQQLFLYEGNTASRVVGGTITDINGAPLADASVALFSDDRQLCQTTTDAEGHYRFILANSETYTIWISKPAYFGNTIHVAPYNPTDHAVVEQVNNITLDNLDLGKPIIINELFGQDASIELSTEGKQKLQRLVRFLFENPQIKMEATVGGYISGDKYFDDLVHQSRVVFLRQYFAQQVPKNKVDINIANSRTNTTSANSQMTVLLK